MNRRRPVLAATALAAACLLTACAADDGDSTAAAGDAPTIRIAELSTANDLTLGRAQFARELEIRASDRLDLVDAASLAFASRFEAPAQLLEGALDEREMEIGLVVEVNVDQRATQPGPPGHLVHRDCVPADFGVERLGRVDDLVTTAIALFLAALGDVGHGAIFGVRLTLCQ